MYPVEGLTSRKLLTKADLADLTDTQRRMALTLWWANGIENALEFIEGIRRREDDNLD